MHFTSTFKLLIFIKLNIILLKILLPLPRWWAGSNTISLKWLILADGRGTNWIKSHIVNKICSAQMSIPISKVRSNVLTILRSNIHFFAAQMSSFFRSFVHPIRSNVLRSKNEPWKINYVNIICFGFYKADNIKRVN